MPLISVLTSEYLAPAISFLAAITFSIVIFYSFRIILYARKHKNRILSLFGGIVAAYVFIDLLPSLQQSNLYLKELGSSSQLVTLYEDSIFLVVFLGFLVFFTLEYLAVNPLKKQRSESDLEVKSAQASKRVFIVHFLALAILDFILSFTLLFEYQAGIVNGLLFTFAVSLHLFIADNSMVENYKGRQTKDGRYIAAVIPIIGWITSVIFPEKIAEAYVLLAFISGSILYQSIKDEIPTVKIKRSLAFFLTGAALYTILLLGPSFI